MIDLEQAKVGYFCTCYFGRRRLVSGWDMQLKDPALSFIIKQLEVVSTQLSVVSNVTFLCNIDEGNAEQEASFASAKELVESHNSTSAITWDIVSRPNRNASYGAWAFGLDTLSSDLDYVFLMEDDYVPVLAGFDEDVIRRYFSTEEAQSNVISAVSVWVDDTLLPADRFKGSKAIRQGVAHAAVSNGIVNVSAYRSVAGGFAFSIHSPGSSEGATHRHYNAACDTQVCYLNPYTESGYRVINMSEHYRIPFISAEGHRGWVFGPPDAPALFSPVETCSSFLQ